MMMVWGRVALLLAAVACVVRGEVVLEADRTISLHTQNARYDTKVTATNNGKEPVRCMIPM